MAESVHAPSDMETDHAVSGDNLDSKDNEEISSQVGSNASLAEQSQGSGSAPGSAGSRQSSREVQCVDSSMGFETDLEIDDEKVDYDLTGTRVYTETCKELGVVPASYFIRYMSKPVLNMKHHGLGPLGTKAIAIPLVSNTNVIELNLEDNWIDTRGAIYIADMLKENCYISHLNLANNKVGSPAVRPLCEMLLINSTLTHVDLSGNGFLPQDAKDFAQVMLENGKITHLNLSHNALGEDKGDQIGHATGENETLERLDLSWNHFRRDSGNKLLDGIQVNSRLKYVNLSWNGLGLECAMALSNCLKNNSILTEIDITYNRITMDAAAIIGKGLEANETLKILRVGKNPIGSDGAQVLLTSINNERSVLTLLDLTDVWVEKEFGDLLKEIKQSRNDLEVKHAGILEGRGGRCRNNSARRKMAHLEKLKRDPMAILRKYVEDNNLRLLDLFTSFDVNKDFRISPEEFKAGVKNAGIDLTTEQVTMLAERLDSYMDCDGQVNYQEMVMGSKIIQSKLREAKKQVEDS